MFAAFSSGFDMSTPGTHQLMRGNGQGAYNGWPVLPKLEALRDEWLHAENKPTQLLMARQIQEQALQDVPYLPLGLYYQPVAYKANLADVPKGLIQFTGLKRA